MLKNRDAGSRSPRLVSVTLTGFGGRPLATRSARRSADLISSRGAKKALLSQCELLGRLDIAGRLREAGIEVTDAAALQDAVARDAFFAQWGNKRAKELGGSAVVILLTSEPKHLEVTVTPEAEKKGFSAKERAVLVRVMLEKLRNGQLDDALLDAVTTLRKEFDVPAKN